MAITEFQDSLDSLGVQALDGVLTSAETDALNQTVSAIPLYYLNHAQHQKTHELYGHWYYPVVLTSEEPQDVEPELQALDESLEPVKVAWRAARRLLPAGSITVNCYVNGYTYGTDGFPHYEVQGSRSHEQRSVLFYCSPRWEPAWGGETIFFDHDGDIAAAILPRPGRVLIFKGDVLHVARAPSRFCPIERRVLVFKAWINGLPPREVEQSE